MKFEKFRSNECHAAEKLFKILRHLDSTLLPDAI